MATDLGVSITAASSDVDYVSRFFIPQLGINEDPVTGSAHCQLVPFWAARLSKTNLRARQLSARGGELSGTLEADRVVGGTVLLVFRGEDSSPRSWFSAPLELVFFLLDPPRHSHLEGIERYGARTQQFVMECTYIEAIAKFFSASARSSSIFSWPIL